MAQIDLNDVLADELTVQGLLTALIDLQEDTNTQLVKVKTNPNNITARNGLITQVEHSFDSINAIIECLQRLNDSTLNNLNIIADRPLNKDGEK
ncbi:hypothetical protein [Limosilactobacillus reuteri]|uniref:hypothetical protein n=1 Tax=Limosilactobacillus reuteri TaxID=1598 RepID=UPI002B05CFE5|nr:hypothetical protein [Limosilactobacillus reuteri]